MARQRMVKPEIWGSETFLSLSANGRLVFFWLISNADDCGIVVGNEKIIANYALCGLPLKKNEIKETLNQLEERGAIYRYTVDHSTYIILCNWFKYQHLDRPIFTTKPLPFGEGSGNVPRILSEWSKKIRRKFGEGSPLIEKNRTEENRIEKNQGKGEGSGNIRGIKEEDLEGIRSLVNEYDLDWVESIGKKIFSLDLGEDDIRDAFCITQEKKKNLRYALGILERKKKEAEAIKAEEEKRQKHYEIEAEGRIAMMQEWQKKNLSPEENMARLQEMVSGLSQKMVMPAETDAPVSL